jgi:two-component system invasion response regulator UvrY
MTGRDAAGTEITVLVVDDHEQFRGAIRDELAALPEFMLIGEAASGEEALATVGSLSPRLVLMDVRMPGMGGIQATAEITNRYHDVVVMLMSVDAAEVLPDAARTCGAAAFLRKQDLRPLKLREMWEMQRDAPGNVQPVDPRRISRPDHPL